MRRKCGTDLVRDIFPGGCSIANLDDNLIKEWTVVAGSGIAGVTVDQLSTGRTVQAVKRTVFASSQKEKPSLAGFEIWRVALKLSPVAHCATELLQVDQCGKSAFQGLLDP